MSGSLKQVLTNPALRRIQLAFFGSTLGDWAYATAVTVWAYQVGGATAVGVFQAVRFVSVAIAGPLGALVADKVSRKHFMLTVDAIRGVLVALAAVSIGLGGPPIIVYVLAVLSGMVGASFRSAQAGLIPRLVSTPDQLTASNAVASNLETAAMFVGPAIGALLISVVDVELVFWLNVVSYAWSFALVAAVRVPAAEPALVSKDEPDDAESFLHEVTVGYAELVRDRDLAIVAGLAAAQGLIWGALTVFTVMMSLTVLDAGAAGVGYLNSVLGIGTVVGGLVMLTRLTKGRLGQDMAIGVLGWALPLVVLAIFPSPVVVFVALALIGFSDAWVNLGLDTIPQRIAPDRILSRVYAAVDSALIGSMALGAAIAPLLVHLLGFRGALALLGGGVTALVLAAFARMRRLDARLALPEYQPAHLELIRSLDLFAPLSPPVQESLARKLEPVSVPVGATILAEGETSDRFYLIVSGAVDVTKNGRLLRIEGPGDFFGEIGLLRDVPRTATISALEPTELLALDRDDFLAAVTGAAESARAAEDVVRLRLGV
ncbi:MULTISPECIES: MFS transporter [unclassified Nocardioides]|uniref:MFS transporter n=1 Tax=unclassified Nocardioides TaxID=2615069 RepID=UPI0009F11729|nr:MULTISPECIES: MFS transporter [unclassified Nocardioides]GAW49957.1 Putative Major facilitator superfamily MFS_1 [Nocardioides sp. PD653-B2]GAW55950.1 putative Major facilitator superfamily MFS_1 [Nocardioides sp. PD653]